VVWARHTISRACQDNLARYCARRAKERKTEEKMGGQYFRVDRTEAERHTKTGREQSGMEGVGC
jgi:hypothetical protein